jgi:Flp pilus assembly protein TadD
MQLNRTDAESLARASAAALQQGRAAEARAGFDRLAASGQANAQIWLLLAYSCRQLGDMAGADRAADEVLRKDEGNIRALIVKGDSRDAAGDDRAAFTARRSSSPRKWRSFPPIWPPSSTAPSK